MSESTFTWDDVRRFTDQLELKIHLAGMDARDRWEALKPKVSALEHDLNPTQISRQRLGLVLLIKADPGAAGGVALPSEERQHPGQGLDERGLSGTEIAVESEYAALATGAEHGGGQISGLIGVVQLHQCAHPWWSWD